MIATGFFLQASDSVLHGPRQHDSGSCIDEANGPWLMLMMCVTHAAMTLGPLFALREHSKFEFEL